MNELFDEEKVRYNRVSEREREWERGRMTKSSPNKAFPPFFFLYSLSLKTLDTHSYSSTTPQNKRKVIDINHKHIIIIMTTGSRDSHLFSYAVLASLERGFAAHLLVHLHLHLVERVVRAVRSGAAVSSEGSRAGGEHGGEGGDRRAAVARVPR